MMLRKLVVGVFAGAAALALSSSASADVMGLLRSGPTSGTGGAGNSSWTFLQHNAGASGYTRGTGLNFPGGTNFTRYTVNGVNNWVNEATAITNNDFVTWHLDFNAAFNLDDMTIRFGRNSTTGANAMSIQLSINNGPFSTVFTDTGGVALASVNGEEHTVNLSAFDNVTKATFRAVLWSASSTNGQFTFFNSATIGNQSFRLNATAVPEPASLGLLALAGVALLRRRQM